MQLKLWVSQAVGERGEHVLDMNSSVAGKHKVRVSIQERSKMGNLKSLTGDMQYRQAEKQGDCLQAKIRSREKG